MELDYTNERCYITINNNELVDDEDDQYEYYNNYNNNNDIEDDDYYEQMYVTVDINEDIKTSHKSNKFNQKNKLVGFNKKNMKKSNDSKVLKKFIKSNEVNVVEYFYNIILSWRINDIKSNNRDRLHNITSLQSFPSEIGRYRDYYDHLIQIIYEEVRVNLHNELISRNNSNEVLSLIYHDILIKNKSRSSKKSNQVLFIVDFTVLKGDYVVIRPGYVFKLSNNINNKEILCTIAQISNNHNKLDQRIISVWIDKQSFEQINELIDNNTVFTAYSLGSFISYQRMFKACMAYPQPPFLQKLLGKKKNHIVFDNNKDGMKILIENDRLNKYQLDALNHCINNICNDNVFKTTGHLELIHGPPGCGKTYFLVELIIHFISFSKKVYVCTSSNKAVCVVIQELFNRLYNNITTITSSKYLYCTLVGVENKLDSGLVSNNITFDVSIYNQLDCTNIVKFIQSINTITNKSVNTSNSQSNYLPIVISNSIAKLLMPQQPIDILIYKYQTNLSNIFSHYSQFFQLIYLFISTRSIDLSESLDILNYLKYIIINSSLDYNKLSDYLYNYIPDLFNLSIDKYIDSSFDLSIQLDRQIDNHKYNNSNYYINSYKSLNDFHYHIIDLFNHFIEYLDTYSDGTNIPLESINSKLLIQLHDLSLIYHIISNYLLSNYLSNFLLSNVISNSQIIFSTMVSAGSSIITNNITSGSIDVLIVDEASQSIEPELIIPISMIPSNVILIGDPCQLSSTLQSQLSNNLSLNHSTMYRLLSNNYLYIHFLSIQYRMNPYISIYPNQRFYSNKLIDSNHVVDRMNLFDQLYDINSLPDVIQKLFTSNVFINVLGCEKKDKWKSIYNPVEATFIVRLITYFNRINKNFIKHICIITFYSAQVNYIQQLLNNNNIHNIPVVTVDSFQGSESDFIIISFVRSNQNKRIGFINDFRRLNVSLTRAKYSLLCIGCERTFLECFTANENNYIKDMISYYKQNNLIINSEDFDSHI